MSSPIPLKEAFVPNSKPPNISRPLIVFIASAQLFFGFDLGFIKQMSNEYKMAAKCFSMTIALVMSCFSAYMVLLNLFGIIYTIQYFFSLITLLTSSYTLYELLLDVMAIKTDIQKDKITENIGKITWMYTIFIFFLKFSVGAIFHWVVDIQDPFIIRLLWLIPVLALDYIPISIFLVYYYVYAKLKQLKLSFQNCNTSARDVQTTYKAVVDLLDKIRSTIDRLTVLGFFADSPKWIVTIWTQLSLLKTTQSLTLLGCGCAYSLHLTLQMCVPAACAELAQAQSDAIHARAHERAIEEEESPGPLSRLARYVEARPILRSAWRVLPPGLRLPAATLSMCATYLIVIIQLTHLYD